MKKIIVLLAILSIAPSVLAYGQNSPYMQHQEIIRNQQNQMWQQQRMHYEDINRREIDRAEQANRDIMYREQMRRQRMYNNYNQGYEYGY